MRVKKIDPLVREYFYYDPDSGVIRWKKKKYQMQAGDEAGTTNKLGYRQLTLNRIFYYGHRIAWYLFYGEDPECEIDHINGVPGDNRIENLRLVTHRENLQNINTHRKGRLPGAHVCNNKNKKWRARVQIGDKMHSIGYYETEIEAHEAYINKVREECL